MTHVKQTRKRPNSGRSGRALHGRGFHADPRRKINVWPNPWIALLVFWIVVGVLCFIF